MIYFCVTTVGSDQAAELADRLVAEKLAACVNIVAGVQSIFPWEGKRQREEEALLLIKTSPKTLGGFEERFRELHPYDCPELLMIPVQEGLKAYFQWVEENCKAGGTH